MGAVDDFRQAMERAGLVPPAMIKPGTMTRFPGLGKTPTNTSAWCWLSADGQVGVYGDWATGLSKRWQAKEATPKTKAERAAQTRRVAELQRVRATEQAKQHAAAARRAQKIWGQSAPAPKDHPYLQTKQIPPDGLRIDGDGWLLVPVLLFNGYMSSLQTIDSTGEKRFLPGGTVKGGRFTIGVKTIKNTIIVCEGFATGASLHEATGYQVVCAFSANNLKPVAGQLSRQFPTATIVLAGDNDIHHDGSPNVGLDAATAAAQAVGGILVMPDLGGKKCDWSDVYIEHGLDAVRAAIDAAVNGQKLPPPTVGDPITATLEMTEKESPMRVQAAAPDTRDEISITDDWPKLDEAAFYGLAGALTKAVEPFSEADPVGILLHCLLASGVMIGSEPHVNVEHAPHYARTNLLVVGVTSGGRKGTAFSPIRHVLSKIDESFVLKRVKSGLSSGEGLIYQVRDAQYEKEPIRAAGHRTGDILGYQDRLVDPGEPDKRLLIIESEFASALTVMEREGNTLSPVLRDTFDHGNLSPLTKKDRISATKAHVGVIGHVTEDELLRKLSATDRANGLANRFAFALVRQSKFLPSGKGTPAHILEPYFARFSRTLERARTRGEMCRDAETEQLWAVVYRSLTEVPQGLTGAILARGAAQVLRLSLIFALLDEAEIHRADTAIRVPHLLAALALWDFCKASVVHIFGDCVGDPIADRLLKAIQSGPQTDTDLYQVLGKHEGDRNRKGLALDLLQRLSRIHSSKIHTAGRSITEWHAGTLPECALCAKRG